MNNLLSIIIGTVTLFILSCSKETTTRSSNVGVGNCNPAINNLIDIDGNIYSIVNIGSQCWMGQNLKVTRFKNGSPIYKKLSDVEWQNAVNLGIAAYCYVGGDSVLSEIYGNLFNSEVVLNAAGICPTGWHVPTDSDWHQLALELDPNAVLVKGTESDSGGCLLKEMGIAHWVPPNSCANNASGFSALPSGCRSDMGPYAPNGYLTLWWSSSWDSLGYTLYIRQLDHIFPRIKRDVNTLKFGLPIRCIMD